MAAADPGNYLGDPDIAVSPLDKRLQCRVQQLYPTLPGASGIRPHRRLHHCFIQPFYRFSIPCRAISAAPSTYRPRFATSMPRRNDITTPGSDIIINIRATTGF